MCKKKRSFLSWDWHELLYSHLIVNSPYVNDVPTFFLYTRIWTTKIIIKVKKKSSHQSLVNDWGRNQSAIRKKFILWFYRGEHTCFSLDLKAQRQCFAALADVWWMKAGGLRRVLLMKVLLSKDWPPNMYKREDSHVALR